LQSQLAFVTTPFNVHGSLSFSTNNNLIIVIGTAPVEVKDITSRTVYPITWTNVTDFVIRLVLNPGVNDYVSRRRPARQSAGQREQSPERHLQPGPSSIRWVRLSSTRFPNAVSTPGTQFIEIVNPRPVQLRSLGMAAGRGEPRLSAGLHRHQWPDVVLSRNYNAFRLAFPGVPQFAQFNANLTSSQRLVLVRPGDPDTIIDGVRYEAAAPWPVTTNGVSLQLIDVSQENARPGNWAADQPRPPRPARRKLRRRRDYPLRPALAERAPGREPHRPDRQRGEPSPWIELYNSGGHPGEPGRLLSDR